MTAIVTRSTGATAKGSPLTTAEMDQNFINLANDVEALQDTVGDIAAALDALNGEVI